MITVSSLPSPIGDINVRRKLQTGATIYEQGDCCQSEVDDQGVSLSSYIHALFSLISQKRSARVLMIGCGGGSLATLLVRAGAQVTVVDNNPNSFFLAHNYFQMPAHVNCVVADGADYLDTCDAVYDAIVLDAYDGSRIPAHLRARRFLNLVKRRLDGSEGIFLANIYLHHDFDLTADRLIHAAGSIWKEATLLDARGHCNRNAIALAGAINTLALPTLLIPPSSQSLSIRFDLSLLKFRAGRLGGGFGAMERFRRLAAAQDSTGRNENGMGR